MLATTLRGMLAHKLRLALTTASIALGVAFLAGTLILTDTMTLAFDQLFGKVSTGTDAVVRQEAPTPQSDGVGTSRGPIPATVLEQVGKVDGVRAAEGSVTGYALLTDNDGKAILTTAARRPGLQPAGGQGAARRRRAARAARTRRADEVAIDATCAEEHHIALGSTIKVLFHGPTQEFTVVGTVGFGGEKNLGGTTSAYFDTATAQKVLGTPGTFDEIHVSAADGVSQAELAKRLSAALPDGAEAVTGKTVAKERSDAIKKDLKIIKIMFLVFAGRRPVRRLVHHLEHLHDDRHPALAGDRTDAGDRRTRRQVMRSLLLEALLLGVAASAVGIGLGTRCGQGAQLPDGRRRLQPCRPRRCRSSRAPSGYRCSSARSSPSSRRSSRPAGRPRFCRSRRCARPPPARRSRR